jgi:hypothetical protein
MRWLLFLSRVAFICGLCFALSFAFLFLKKWDSEPISQTVIVIGFGVGLVVVPITLICYLGVLIARRKLPVTLWLVIANIVFLFVLMLYLLFINVKSDYPS